MRKDGLQHPDIQRIISRLGHTQSIVICDIGLPIPEGANVVDLALKKGMPEFIDVLKTVSEDLVCEKYIIAKECEENNQHLYRQIQETMNNIEYEVVPHDEFKKNTNGAVAFIRTGSCIPFANIILIGGVNF